MEQLSGYLHPAVMAGVIGVVIQLLKAWNVKNKYYFLVSVMMGLVIYTLVFFTEDTNMTILQVLLNGLVAGGTASGIYSGAKAAGVKLPKPKRKKL